MSVDVLLHRRQGVLSRTLPITCAAKTRAIPDLKDMSAVREHPTVAGNDCFGVWIKYSVQMSAEVLM